VRPRSLLVAFAAAAVPLCGLTACGDDDGGASQEFCDGVAEFNAAATSVELDEDASRADVEEVGEQIVPIWDRVRNNAPEDLQEVLAPVSEAVDALGEGDPSQFSSDETLSAYNEFVGDAVEECDFDTIEVTAVDYAFEDVPDEIDAGTVAVTLTNDAESEDHEFLVFRKNDPDQSTSEILELAEDEVEEAVTFAGAVSAPPGQSATSLFNLEPGSYAAVCFIPVGGDEDAPPHAAEGMVTDFTVE
jgi:uncharacterized cupredoxin-like copper-binding protein